VTRANLSAPVHIFLLQSLIPLSFRRYEEYRSSRETCRAELRKRSPSRLPTSISVFEVIPTPLKPIAVHYGYTHNGHIAARANMSK
jgi:hypothetical protein